MSKPIDSILPDARALPRKGGQITVVHVVVVALSLLMTFGAWQFSKQQIQTRIATRFEAAREQALGLITERMRKYEDALWAGVSAMESHGGRMTYDEWRAFAHTLRIEDKYPGINGIGVIHYLSEAALPAYLAERRLERPDFAVYPEHAQPELMPISFIEPEAINAAAVGLDVAHEVNRRAGALASRDTGEAQITGPIVLVQDAGSTPGFLFYAPFYSGDPTTAAERREQILGAVYAPFVVRKLMEGLLAKDLRPIRFSISDAGQVIYDEHTPSDPLYDPEPMFTEQVSIDLYGRTWTLDLRTNLAFREGNTYAQPMFILLGGLLIEGLILALLFLMARANAHAVSYADKVTAALKQESSKLIEANAALAATNDRLAGANRELEQFVYVASHDLKTPIRGIASLTEMVQEDLEDYFAEPNANPEVAFNLERIQERVKRMNDLTRGVMEFSRIGAAQEGVEEPVILSEAVRDMISDFDLEADQLRLSGDVTAVQVNALSFRRVLENLVGNAVKYHDGTKRLQIEISTETCGDRLRFSVADNGPGIDPSHHERIFNMFQTLQSGEAESTGIGLAIVKKAVEHGGGAIQVESALGAGATFRFDWPNAAQEETVFYSDKAA